MKEIGEGEPGEEEGFTGSGGERKNRGIRGEIGGGGSTGRTTETFVEGSSGSR